MDDEGFLRGSFWSARPLKRPEHSLSVYKKQRKGGTVRSLGCESRKKGEAFGHKRATVIYTIREAVQRGF